MNTLLKMENVTKYYGSGESISKALSGVSFSLRKGEFTAIMGASGSGKSTLLNVIATIDRPSSGSIFLAEKNIAEMREQELSAFRRDCLGFIFQDYNLLDTLTVAENIVLPLNLQKRSVAETEKKLQEVVNLLEIEEQIHKFPSQLSGGQRQRVACARALITQPELILADEPTGALDSKMGNEILKFFKQLNHDLGITIVMITHEFDIAKYADRLIHIRDGKINYDGRVPRDDRNL